MIDHIIPQTAYSVCGASRYDTPRLSFFTNLPVYILRYTICINI